jgi:uncharacterized membrane protein YbhN (UPF0104 family)
MALAHKWAAIEQIRPLSCLGLVALPENASFTQMIALARRWYRWSQHYWVAFAAHPLLPWLLRLLISLTALSYVTWRVWQERETLTLSQQWLQAPFWLGVALALLPINLGLEAGKWRILLRNGEFCCSLGQALRAILAGAATGIFTPNRLGDYAGRLLPLPPGHRLWAAVYTFVCRIAQMAITVALGALGLALLHDRFALPAWLETSYPWWLGIAGLLGLIGTLGFLWPRPLQLWLSRIPLPESMMWRAREALISLSVPTVRRVWGLSLLRGMIFLGQYAALLMAFGFEGSPLLALALASITLLIKSLAPSIALAELGVRESVALAVMGLAQVSAPVIVAATFALFLINLILPALAGLLVISGRGTRTQS